MGRLFKPKPTSSAPAAAAPVAKPQTTDSGMRTPPQRAGGTSAWTGPSGGGAEEELGDYNTGNSILRG
jgi:hypothetical protein